MEEEVNYPDYYNMGKALRQKHKMFGQHDPGGAEVRHPIFGILRLTACDDKEDYERVVEFLKKHGIEP